MSPNLTLAVLAGVFFGAGVVLLLSRSLVRALLGVLLMGNAVNVVYVVASGAPGKAPIVAKADAPDVVIGPDGISDPLPQAMVLTAIVITLGIAAFVLSMAYRSWQLNGHDEVQDDLEDRRLARRAARDEVDARATDDSGGGLADLAAATKDETATEEDDAAERRRVTAERRRKEERA